MGRNEYGNDEIELLQDAVIAVVAMARGADSDRVKLAMDILLAGTSQLGTVFQQRCVQLASQKQPRRAKPPKSAPVKGPQQRKPPASSTDTPGTQKDAEDRSKELSSIQQGIRQAEPSPSDQQRALRGYLLQNNGPASVVFDWEDNVEYPNYNTHECSAVVTVNGIYDGTTVEQTERVRVIEFIVDDSENVLAHGVGERG